jgi:hypothetical protein
VSVKSSFFESGDHCGSELERRLRQFDLAALAGAVLGRNEQRYSPA